MLNTLSTTAFNVYAFVHKFTGKERDTESGLDYFGARYYASNMGRWTSPDPLNLTDERLLNPQTLNKYGYAANNPLKYIDPDGKDITYFYDPGGTAGHAVLFAYNQATGDSALESFGPNIHAPLGLRESNFDMNLFSSAQGLRDNYVSLTIQTNPELTQEVISYIRSNPDPHSGGRRGAGQGCKGSHAPEELCHRRTSAPQRLCELVSDRTQAPGQ